MKKFVKTTLMAGLALAAVEANAANQNAIIGCAAPGNNTTGSTVYSIDATNSAGAAQSLSSYVALGQPCSSAINAMLQTYALVGYSNQTIQNAGYSLQVFNFSDDLTGAANTIMPSGTLSVAGLIGCAAPGNGTSGATVYSIDAKNSTNTNISSTLNARLGAACSNALSTASTTSGIGASTGVATGAIAGTTKIIPVNVTISNAGYSLEQFLIAQ